MPAKKKGKKGKKKKGAKEEPEPEDHYMQMKGEQLEITIANLREKLSDAKIKRNMLQIEKDMIHDFYHNTREEIKELEARISNFDTEMQNAEENQKTDTNSHMQKVKHLYYEHENSCNQVKAEAKNIMSSEHQNHGENEKLAQKNKQEKKDHYGQEEYANIAEIEDKEK